MSLGSVLHLASQGNQTAIDTLAKMNAAGIGVTAPTAEQQAQQDAAFANALKSYLSPHAYLSTVTEGELQNNIDTSGREIPAGGGFGPTQLTQQQVDLYAKAKIDGHNPSDPTELLAMLGIAKTYQNKA